MTSPLLPDVRAAVVAALDEIAGLMSNPEIGPALARGEDVPFARIEMDSLTRFEVIMRLEEAFGIELDDDEVLAQDSVGGLAGFIEGRLAGRAG
ncbi:MAG: acyl carrier protein [Rhodobacteraceae bacterium]|jgi:acyl carrier protein|nr:acyl carrier protein [Paracoccaceae bacterium]